ncbi:hypothetical protein AA313_de0207882 [Arthrobotrys entomopaga]|nr:hypothetical protein AA313_de0207882 [Arthrobotrys entomopaga]
MNSNLKQTALTTLRSISHVSSSSTPARERIVILGSGWAGFTLSRQLKKSKYEVIVVSPRSYFVFTPLLASTAVGTLEFRTTLEPVRARNANVDYIQGWADDVNLNEKTLTIEAVMGKPKSGSYVTSMSEPSQVDGLTTITTPAKKKGELFNIKYDKLVVAVGCYSQTFGTKGVKENALFLKDVGDARRIRSRILQCFEIASLPTTSESLRKQLLNFAIVGGGPTGIEFAAELFDLCHEDLIRLYPTLVPSVRISIYDIAPKILPMFDSKLAAYAMNLFRRDGISIKTEHHIEELRPGLPSDQQEKNADAAACLTLVTKEEGEIGIGMCVWSTGLMMNPFVRKALDSVHTYPTSSAKLNTPDTIKTSPSSLKWSLKRDQKTGGLMVDDRFRVKLVHPESSAEATMSDVFAIGDVSVMEKSQLPATAQVANQEANWLGKHLNAGDIDSQKFTFRNLGTNGMAYLERRLSYQNGQLEE